MIVKYDSLNRLEKPKITLCNPGSTYTNGVLTRVVGILNNQEAEEIVFNFNATSELNLRVNCINFDDPEDNAHAYSLYQSIQNRRLLFVENIGYFMITNIEDGFGDGLRHKDIKAQSADVEIQQKMIPYIEDGTYRFITSVADSQNEGILNKIVQSIPLWEIGEVDSAIAERYRTFEDVDTSLNCLGFLMENLQDAYECIFVFDIVTRTINVYDQASYVKNTNIHITNDDLINSINVTENADDLYTAISVTGNDDVVITAVNPLGTSVIYDFSYYLGWMSDGLGSKVAQWKQDVQSAEAQYYDLNLQKFTLLEEKSNIELEIERVNICKKMYQKCKENIIAEGNTDSVGNYNEVITENGGTEIPILQEVSDLINILANMIDDCNDEIAEQTTDLNTKIADLSDLEDDILDIHNTISFDSYFSNAELTELNHYIFEGAYTDEYVVITDTMTYPEKFEQMKLLYDRAKTQLAKVSTPTQEFSIDVENFIFEKEFQQWSEQLETGCLINVELSRDDVAMLFLSNITVNYDDHSLKMTFGNRLNKFDPKSLFDDILGDISKSANTLSYIKELLTPIANGEFDYVKEALQTSRNLTMNSVLSSTNEEVIIDESGYTGRRLLSDGSGEYDPKQIKITGRALVFTDDSWESCKVALGDIQLGDGVSVYGINAENIIGDMILGHGLRILDNNGNELLSVIDGKISTAVSGKVDGQYVSSQITQLANSISLSVSTENGVASSITLGVNGENKGTVDITGFVTFRSLEDEGTTTINGAVIETGTINANTLHGDVIIGEELNIHTHNNDIVMDDSGLTITTSAQNATGLFCIRKQTGENTYSNLIYSDSTGGINITGGVTITGSVRILDSNGNELFSVIDSKISAAVSGKTDAGTVSSMISQEANRIMTTVNQKTDAGTVSSMIDQFADKITLSVSVDGNNRASICLGVDGETKTGTIDMSGLVTFSSLSAAGETVINGSNITSGTINAELLKFKDNSFITRDSDDEESLVIRTSGRMTIGDGGTLSTGIMSSNNIVMNSNSVVIDGTQIVDIRSTDVYLSGNIYINGALWQAAPA